MKKLFIILFFFLSFNLVSAVLVCDPSGFCQENGVDDPTNPNNNLPPGSSPFQTQTSPAQTTPSAGSGAANGLQYDLVSFSENSQNRANTPFFNVSFLNQKTYTINYQNFATGFQFFFDLLIGISIATAVILFMVAALQQIISKNDVWGIKKGKEGMVNAIVGLMIILSTWLIINTINPDLLRLPMFQGLDGLNANSKTSASQSNITADSI